MSPVGLAWRSLNRDPARLGLGVAGLAAVGALLLDMLLLSRGLVVSFGDLLRSTGFDVRVTATESLPGVGPPIARARELGAAIRRLPEVEDVVALHLDEGVVEGPAGPPIEVSVIGTDARDERGEWRMERGQGLQAAGPGGPPPAVISRALARDLGVEPGSPLALRARGERARLPPVALRVAGVARFAFEAAAEHTLAVRLEDLERALHGEVRGEADLLLVASRPGVEPERTARALRRAFPDLHPFSTAQFLERFERTEFSYFRQISFVLASITSFFAFLLVATLLTVAVNQRLGEVAALRALGFTRGRLALDLLAEAALLMGAGGLLALPLGLLVARVLDGILRGVPGFPERLHFFVLEPRAVLLHGVLLGAAGLAAAAYPVWLAVRLPVAATLRKEVA